MITIDSLPSFQKLAIPKSDFWAGSIYEPLKRISAPAAKGAIAEKLVSEYMESLGHIVLPATSRDFDRIINGHATEIKFSTTWGEQYSKFTWQQIRNTDYDRIIFFGVNPTNAWMHWATKRDLEQHVFGQDRFRQHAGQSGNQELYWLRNISSLPWFRHIKDF